MFLFDTKLAHRATLADPSAPLHLPHDTLRGAAAEARRVLKSGGRLLVVDMGGPQDGRPTMHARHGGPLPFDLDHVAEHLGDVGLVVVETGPIESGMRRLERLRYLLATPAMSPGAR